MSTVAESTPLLVCPCREIIVKIQDGVTKVRSKILLFRDGKALAVCKRCDGEIAVPLRLTYESSTVSAASSG